MACGCDGICPNNCNVNSDLADDLFNQCGGNTYSFTTINVGDIIRASHLAELETAINNERTDATRRFNDSAPSPCAVFTGVFCSNNDWSAYPFSGSRSIGDIIDADHFTNVKNANNEVVSDSGYGDSVSISFSVGDIIEAADINDLQNKINGTRTACIADGQCNCDQNCGCDGECPSDDPYYYGSPTCGLD